MFPLKRAAIVLILMSLPGCATKTPPPSTPPALAIGPDSALMRPCPDLPADAKAGDSRDEDIGGQQKLYDGCARKVDGWIAYWRLVQESVEARP